MVSKMSQHMAGTGVKGRIAAAKQLQQAGPGSLPGMPAIPGMPGAKKSTRSTSPKKKFKKRKR
jgi:hypothetical protein